MARHGAGIAAVLMMAALFSGTGAAVAPATSISPEHPLIILQTTAAFGDTDEGPPDADKFAEADRHGMEVVRLWNLLPEDMRPLCQLQVELRVRDHDLRLELFRRVLREPQREGVAVCVQIADPQDEYVFDPDHAERLLGEFSCIRSVVLSELHFAHYDEFNVERYAVPPHTRYTADIIRMAARGGRHVVLVLQGLKWLHVSADALNRPLLDAMRENAENVIVVNEHIEPRHLPRQTTVWGLWLGGYAAHWGVEPQSWWYESSFMNGPGVFGDHLHPLEMPPGLYRPMILQGAAMGATVYSFEPWWDLFDYDNSRCWTEVILPALREVVHGKLVPDREEVFKKTKVAYQAVEARNINDFHRNLRDLDWISDEGLLARAAYGVWEPMLEFELVPNKGNWFIPILPPRTPQAVLDRFPCVARPGQCASVEEWEALLKQHYPETAPPGSAWTCSINGHSYVMHTHENLYERQSYALALPKPVRGMTAAVAAGGLRLEWPADPGARRYFILRGDDPQARPQPVAETTEPRFTEVTSRPGFYTVTAETTTTESVSGTVNYLDCLVFSGTVSEPAEQARLDGGGKVEVTPVVKAEDTRPASQVVYPTFDGVPGDGKVVADEIVARIDAFKTAYEAMDWRTVTDFYDPEYEDANGFHREYAGRAWKWWFRRNNKTFLLRQIRHWDFAEHASSGQVTVKMLFFCTAVRRDDQPFGYDGIVRIPRHKGAEVTLTWERRDGVWRIVRTEPALPNLEEILWNDRPMDRKEKLVPGLDE